MVYEVDKICCIGHKQLDELDVSNNQIGVLMTECGAAPHSGHRSDMPGKMRVS